MMTKVSVVVSAWVLCAPLLVGQGQSSDTLSSAAQQQRPQQPQPSHADHPIPGMQMPSAQQPTPSQQGVQMPEPAKHARDENAQAVTLEQLEQIALSSNPTLGQAAAEIRAAEGRRRQAGLYPNPTLGYIGEEIRGGASQGGEQGFFVRQDIVLGGKLGLSRQVIEQERQQAVTESEEQRLRVLNNVRLFYYEALAAQSTVALRTELSRLTKDAVQTSQQLRNVGQADEPDVLQAEVEAEQSDLALITAEQRQQRVWRGLAAVVGKPDLPLTRLAGDLEQIPELNPGEWLATILRESPAVKIAEISVRKSEAALARARREPIPDLQLRGGLQQNRELRETSGQPVGWQGFAELGVQIPLFNRNQGNVPAARADVERSRLEVDRVRLLLRERASVLFQNYQRSRAAVDRYRTQMLPRARRAYELYFKSYQNMAAAYPQVLIAQRTWFQLQTDYVSALETLWTNSVAVRSFMLTDGLEAPSRPGEMDRPVREINLPSSTAMSTEER